MLIAFDAHYSNTTTKLVAASFNDWTDPAPEQIHIWTSGAAAAYQPGQFYLREMPLIIKALEDFNLEDVKTIIVDGYVYLDANGRLGLGGHLYHELNDKVPVIGVAKSYFRDNNAVPILRGESKKPLYVTAFGMPPEVAAEHIRGMAGKYRMPDVLGAVDQETKRN
jgi:deoxyinosine 3'endonuclease (endonuclease V)